MRCKLEITIPVKNQMMVIGIASGAIQKTSEHQCGAKNAGFRGVKVPWRTLRSDVKWILRNRLQPKTDTPN